MAIDPFLKLYVALFSSRNCTRCSVTTCTTAMLAPPVVVSHPFLRRVCLQLLLLNTYIDSEEYNEGGGAPEGCLVGSLSASSD